jgi:hypothetical protein
MGIDGGGKLFRPTRRIAERAAGANINFFAE